MTQQKVTDMPDGDGTYLVAQTLVDAPCDYCGSTECDPVLTGRDRLAGLPGRFQVVSCRRCGLMRTSPRLPSERLGDAYRNDYECHQWGRADVRPPTGLLRWLLVNYRGYPLGRAAPAPLRFIAWPLAALVLRNRKNVGYVPYQGQGRLLDFGCGGGRYVAQMVAAGWKAEGMDFAGSALAEGRKAGLTLHEGTLPGAPLPAESYDVVTLWHVLEHVPSPLATLRAIRDVLRPGGRLVVVCPLSDGLCARWFGQAWYGLDVPRHLTHFTRATLRRHLEAAGLLVERERPIRRPTFFRRSARYLADDTGRSVHRWLAGSHLVSRVASHLAALTGRTDEVLFVARRP